jgi:hypothetical protein
LDGLESVSGRTFLLIVGVADLVLFHHARERPPGCAAHDGLEPADASRHLLFWRASVVSGLMRSVLRLGLSDDEDKSNSSKNCNPAR